MKEGEAKGKKERETRTGEEDFLRLDVPCWLCHGSQLLGAIKG
jgi:hypothetical protein